VIASGSLTIDDFNEMVGTQLPHDGPRTLAGLVLEALGRRPDPGDTVTVDGVVIRVESLNGLRTTSLRVTLPG
jgi:putative hemolysin